MEATGSPAALPFPALRPAQGPLCRAKSPGTWGRTRVASSAVHSPTARHAAAHSEVGRIWPAVGVAAGHAAAVARAFSFLHVGRKPATSSSVAVATSESVGLAVQQVRCRLTVLRGGLSPVSGDFSPSSTAVALRFLSFFVLRPVVSSRWPRVALVEWGVSGLSRRPRGHATLPSARGGRGIPTRRGCRLSVCGCGGRCKFPGGSQSVSSRLWGGWWMYV